jgi:hypothetical protein
LQSVCRSVGGWVLKVSLSLSLSLFLSLSLSLSLSPPLRTAILCCRRITRSDGLRQSAINIAEGRKRAVVLESEAARVGEENRAQGEAAGIKARAEAEMKGARER